MLILPVKTKMTTFKGTLKYVVLKNLNDIYFLSVNLIAIIILVIISFNAKSLNYDSAYQYFNLYGFFIALSIGKGVISEELSNRHAELIFTKPIKKKYIFFYLYWVSHYEHYYYCWFYAYLGNYKYLFFIF